MSAPSGVTTKENASASNLDDVSVVAAVCVVLHPRSPVIHFEGVNGRGADSLALVPLQLLDQAIAARLQEISGIRGGYYSRLLVS